MEIIAFLHFPSNDKSRECEILDITGPPFVSGDNKLKRCCGASNPGSQPLIIFVPHRQQRQASSIATAPALLGRYRGHYRAYEYLSLIILSLSARSRINLLIRESLYRPIYHCRLLRRGGGGQLCNRKSNRRVCRV